MLRGTLQKLTLKVCPTYFLYRLSCGLTATAVSPSFVSGLVVEMVKGKSFEYLKANNYNALMAFIESGNYQVHIYGHYCGISDMTMLREIFEHDHCLSIKIFYHQQGNEENDFTEKLYEIARHFTDKGMFRKKVVNFKLSSPIPQPIVKKFVLGN